MMRIKYALTAVALATFVCVLHTEKSMSDVPRYQIIRKSGDDSELERFASWFHQDYDLMFSGFREGARMYMESLSPERKIVLRQELVAFLNAHRDKSVEEIRKSWLRAGAGAWDLKNDFRQEIAEYLRMLGKE